jgi:L-lactate dehydrogenase complex protein LldG
LAELVAAKRHGSLLLAPDTPHGARAAEALRALPQGPQLRSFDQPLEQWKDELFNGIDAAFTGSRAGIADTGTLIVWPDVQEPRTMSLVPPVHYVLFDASRLYQNFHQAMTVEGWRNGLPTNSLLISGPSKTADIQQTLAYGAHGPRELIVLVQVPDEVDLAELEVAA